MIEDDYTPDGSDVMRAAALRNSVSGEAVRFLSMAALAGVDIERPLADMALDSTAEQA